MWVLIIAVAHKCVYAAREGRMFITLVPFFYTQRSLLLEPLMNCCVQNEKTWKKHGGASLALIKTRRATRR
jgi:hypothetical protein